MTEYEQGLAHARREFELGRWTSATAKRYLDDCKVIAFWSAEEGLITPPTEFDHGFLDAVKALAKGNR